MKRKVGIFFYLLIMLSACGTPVAIEPATQIQPSSTSVAVITPIPAQKATSTPDPLLKEASGRNPFCQVEPQKARLGSSVNISAFQLPANHAVSIFIYYEENRTIRVLPDTILTDENGYVNIDIVIPRGLSTEKWARIALIAEGPLVEASCGVWPWTDTSLATYSARQTEVHAPTLTVPPEQAAMTATQQALHAKLDKYCVSNQAWGFRLSPNGQWIEVACSVDTVEVVRVDESKKWKISSDTLINPYTEYFVGINHWSHDGMYAYTSPNPHTDGYWEPFHQGVALFRVNLETGEINEVLPLSKEDWIFYSYAFSPDDSQLAYIVTDQSPVVLKLRDLQTGAEQSFEFDSKYNTGGGFVWAPISQKLVFSITQYDTGTFEYVGTSIFLWDQQTAKATELVKDHKSQMQATEWIDETKILLKAIISDSQSITTQNYEFDLTTSKLTEVNP